MHPYIRTAAILLTTATLGAARPAHAAKDPMTVVVGNGPFAGTYHIDDVLCVIVKETHKTAGTWKEFSPKSAKAIDEAAVSIDYPEKHKNTGDLLVAFGHDKAAVEYDVYNTTVILTPAGKGGTLVGTGKTKEGIALKISATCGVFESD